MKIKASDVKKIRDKTGAGMMDCKEALECSEGDFAKAEKILKKRGLAYAKKKEDRAVKAGRIFLKISKDKGVLLKLLCETDFVAKNEDFIALGEKCITSIDKKSYLEKNDELEEYVKDTIAKMKENIVLDKFSTIKAGSDDILKGYIHGEGQIGAIVMLKIGDISQKDNSRIKGLAKDLVLHIAACAPLYISKDNVDESYLKKQKEIFLKQAHNLGKPDKLVQKITQGKMNKHLTKICLLDQKFIKEEKQCVYETIKIISQEIDVEIQVKDFLYYKIGNK